MTEPGACRRDAAGTVGRVRVRVIQCWTCAGRPECARMRRPHMSSADHSENRSNRGALRRRVLERFLAVVFGVVLGLVIAEMTVRTVQYVSPPPGHTWIPGERVLVDLYPENARGMLPDVRSDPELARTPIIAMSAKSYKSDIDRARELGATDYVVKPFKTEELLELVERHLAEPGGTPNR